MIKIQFQCGQCELFKLLVFIINEIKKYYVYLNDMWKDVWNSSKEGSENLFMKIRYKIGTSETETT